MAGADMVVVEFAPRRFARGMGAYTSESGIYNRQTAIARSINADTTCG